ncbi:hypothetical protein [Methylotenera sp.]|nr:hypothetical protein [Methylotenera sp.]MDO9205949.1 hypothetical protein [Methylotenera sp.]MDP1522269.1 hypothetical protein [Methylotenera sp.]MDP2071060.1 hypothetical protein [Methylotenera sp.]MDP2231163.1 hypothetical protein [Methylotenera sp.]MDP3005934.1 hypothetical protein [Methylotenera sp.]
MKSVIQKTAITFIVLINVMASASAAESKAGTLLYISPNDYQYSVRLLHPYYDYWFEQGPIVEPIALKALNIKYGEVSICTANETADTIIRIKPNLFYNPQMRVYHSKIVATVYSGGGSVMGTYVGQAQQQGFISVDNGTNYHINKVYTLAMQDLTAKLEVKPLPENVKAENKLPCGLIGAQEQPKINFY